MSSSMSNLLQFRTVLSMFVINKFRRRYRPKTIIPFTCYCKFDQLRYYKSGTIKPTLESPAPLRVDGNIITFLTTNLNCSVKDAEVLYNDHKQFLIHNHTNLTETLQVLEKSGFSKHAIVNNFWILFFGKGELTSRMDLFKKWGFTNPNKGIHILNLPLKKLLRYTKQTEYEYKLFDSMNRITYFSSFVQCDEERTSQLFVKYQFMMTLKVESLKSILTLVKEQGILTEDLLSDLWVFRYSPQFILKRIKHLDNIEAKAKCEVIKPWMLRCTEVILNRHFEIKDENLAALGEYSNLKDLLSNELGLPAAQVEEMIFKHPPLAKISYSKAKEMIEFLKAQGFSSTMIYHMPRVLCHKQATLVARMMELKQISPNLINLQNICRNKKDYISFVNKMTV